MLAAIVGACGGLAGFYFRETLLWLQETLMGNPAVMETSQEVGGRSIVEAGRNLTNLWTVLMPAIGGIAAGLILLLIGKRHCPFGISDIMELVASRRSRIPFVRSFLQICSSACSLASGGSLGREGAITQMGTTIASLMSNVFREGARNKIILVACGTAAGMASSYRAPIAGAIFVMEVILGSFAMEVFAPLVVASVVSTLVTSYLLDNPPALYQVVDIHKIQAEFREQYEVVLNSPGLVLSAIILGILCGCGGVLFNGALGLGKRLFSLVPGPAVFKLALGGLAVGGIGLGYPEVWGNGLEAIKQIQGGLANPSLGLDTILLMTLGILVLKVIATSLTTGSGGLGGVFTPTLVVGASFGGFFACGLQWLGQDLSFGNKKAFTLVGMAGICAATTHAPITAIILIFELTRDYGIILPVMLCSIIASLTARSLRKDSYYTARLRSRAGHAAGLEELAMQSNYVRDIMRKDLPQVMDTASFEQVMDVFSSTRCDIIYVVDSSKLLLGRIHLHDIKYYINDPSLGSVVIAADLTRPAVTATPDENLATILERFDDPDLDELAVVASAESAALQGRITRRDLMACLSDEVLGQRKLRTRMRPEGREEDSLVQLPKGTELNKLSIPNNMVGRTLGSLDFPDGVVTLLVLNFGEDGLEQRQLAEPQCILGPGAQIVVMGTAASILTAEQSLTDPNL